MTENIEEKYQTSEEFEQLSFGCLEEVSGYGYAKDMQEIGSKSSSSISNFICGIIKDGLSYFDKKQSPLYDHFVAYNDGDRVIYIRAEIKFDTLEKGEDISNDVLEHFQCYGLPGDIVTQHIPKSLGGYDSGDNSFNLNPTVCASRAHFWVKIVL
uniref:Uncharacterized protein n=1 Tax=Panagrolaimus davidi TaxID=227884 RepID=A0A914PNM3_9BILA